MSHVNTGDDSYGMSGVNTASVVRVDLGAGATPRYAIRLTLNTASAGFPVLDPARATTGSSAQIVPVYLSSSSDSTRIDVGLLEGAAWRNPYDVLFAFTLLKSAAW